MNEEKIYSAILTVIKPENDPGDKVRVRLYATVRAKDEEEARNKILVTTKVEWTSIEINERDEINGVVICGGLVKDPIEKYYKKGSNNGRKQEGNT